MDPIIGDILNAMAVGLILAAVLMAIVTVLVWLS
jgi:hypothetical protein